MTSFDEIREIITILKSEHLDECAKNIENVMCSNVSLEVWMGIRFYLSQITSDSVSSSAFEKIETFRRKIN